MATLSDTNRQLLWSEFMEFISRENQPLNLTKIELRAVVDAMDNWIDSNMPSLNSALPLPGRTELTTKQKVRIFMFIIGKRWEVEP